LRSQNASAVAAERAAILQLIEIVEENARRLKGGDDMAMIAICAGRAMADAITAAIKARGTVSTEMQNCGERE
jgi:hypothetical protein